MNGSATQSSTKLPEGKVVEALAAWVKQCYESMKSDRQRIRRQWDINLQMYSGNQYIQEITGKNGFSRLVTPPAPRHRERSVTNRTRPIVRTEITRLTSQKPSVTVVPASGEDDDLFAAQAGEAVWEFLFEHERIQFKLERMAFWASVTGNGFFKTWWDPTKQDNLFKDIMGTPTVGNVQFAPVTPYNLFVPDLLEEDIEAQPHVFEVYTRPVEWANMFFKGQFTPDVVSKREIFESSYFQSTGQDNSVPDSVLVTEAYIKPGSCPQLKQGGFVQMVGNTVVGFVEGMPYQHQEYPYTHIKSVMTGKFYADSILVDTNPLQIEYNKTRNQIIESKQRTARPQILVPVGSIDPSKYTSEPGKLVMYKAALGKPEILEGAPIPNFVMEEQGRIIADIEDISGQHQVSRGMAPGQGVVAATAIAFLQEKDETLHATVVSSMEQGITKIARQGLSLVVDYWDVPRIVRVTGTDRAFDSMELKGSDIANSLDVRCEPGSSLPQSKSARQALLMDLFKASAITAQQMLDQMDIGGVNSLVDRMRVDMRAAQRENLKMKQLTPQSIADFTLKEMENALVGGPGSRDPETGIPTIDPANLTTYPPVIKVNEWDNHMVHITVHNNYRKSQEFAMLAPEVQDQFAKHIKIHQMYSYSSMMNPMMGQAMAGAPNSAMGMAPEMVTGPDSAGGGSGMPAFPDMMGGMGGPGMPAGAAPATPPGTPPQTM